jgi:LysR family transcriptional activator of nhaA
MSFFASALLQKGLKGKFPACLNGAPMLVPGVDAAVRARLDRWCEAKGLRPRVVGEFDDSALMKAFGQRNAGVFIGPTVLEAEIETQYGVKKLGRVPEIVDEYFAISVERRVTHPCVVAITEAARNGLFVTAGAVQHRRRGKVGPRARTPAGA